MLLSGLVTCVWSMDRLRGVRNSGYVGREERRVKVLVVSIAMRRVL